MEASRRRKRGYGILLLATLLPAAAATAQVDTGSADFSRYVAMGDSLTAAFTSGALLRDAQDHSYSLLIHRQATGSADWEQPLVSSPGIPPVLQLRSLAPLTIAPAPGLGSPINLTLPRPYDNLGVPGADVYDVVNTVTDNGGAHDLVLRGIGTQLQQAAFQQPSFVTLWIGNNDVLGAATSGLVIEGVTLTSVADFERDFAIIGQTLQAAGVEQGAVATIPSVTSIPFVTTLPPVVLNPDTGEPLIIDGRPVPLIGIKGGIAQPLTFSDYVLLTASPLLARGVGLPPPIGAGQPLPDEVVLDEGEVSRIVNRTNALNSIIRAGAAEAGVALVDTNAVFGDVVRNGLEIGGIEFGPEFLTGGLFSYDGVHPTPLGYAIIANAFIESINRFYDARIPSVGLSPYVFGEAGRIDVPEAVPFSDNQVGSLKFTRRAAKNLRWALGLPGPKKLKRLAKAQQQRSPAEVGGEAATRSSRVRRSEVTTTRVRTRD